MRLFEEARVDTRTLEAGLLKDRGHLFRVGTDRTLAECRDELVEVAGRLPRLDRIGLRAGCILGRHESLRDREWCGAVSSSPPHPASVIITSPARSGMAKRTAVDPTECNSDLTTPGVDELGFAESGGGLEDGLVGDRDPCEPHGATVHTFVSMRCRWAVSAPSSEVARDLAGERERVAPGLEEVAAYGLAEPDHVQPVRQRQKFRLRRSRGLPIELDDR